MLCSSENEFVEFVSNRQLKETNGYCVIFKINVIEELKKKLERNYLCNFRDLSFIIVAEIILQPRRT